MRTTKVLLNRKQGPSSSPSAYPRLNATLGPARKNSSIGPLKPPPSLLNCVKGWGAAARQIVLRENECRPVLFIFSLLLDGQKTQRHRPRPRTPSSNVIVFAGNFETEAHVLHHFSDAPRALKCKVPPPPHLTAPSLAGPWGQGLPKLHGAGAAEGERPGRHAQGRGDAAALCHRVWCARPPAPAHHRPTAAWEPPEFRRGLTNFSIHHKRTV